ncbi:proline dehydrogenase family protein [Cellulomonas sp. 179-A 9B4 NHS]|uniref:proline dehydrogenase family protein n=1 Tax=Cellulomonas sp. 179-A 9B4 NHS TaxID=3142379 RepID=UPI0039A28E1C
MRRLEDDAVALVRRWLDASAAEPVDTAAQQLADVLADPDGLAFTVGFVDRVVRPEDDRVAARELAALAASAPAFLAPHLRLGVRAGALAARVAPGLVVPVVRRALRAMVGHLLVDASEARLGAAIARLRRPGVQLNLNLLGEAVLGRREADRRLAGIRALVERDDVDYVSVKVSAAVAPHAPYAFDETVDEVVARLAPLYDRAAATGTFVNLDMEEYRDLDLTVAVFTRLLDRPELLGWSGGIVLQAYLPDAVGAMLRLQEWAAARRARGGAPVKVRLVKGANLPMERVEAAMHGWLTATWPTKQETDTQYKRVLDVALRPDAVDAVRLGVAGHNLFDLALAWLLAGARGVRDAMDVEMLLGMAQAQAEVVRRDVGRLLLYVPVVHPREFDVAIAYLVRRLEEGASPENFLSAAFDLADDASAFERERARFSASLRALDDAVPAPRRTQDRRRPPEPVGEAPFANAPDTDPALPANREWGRAVLARAARSALGVDTLAAARLDDADALDRVLATAVGAADAWAARGGRGRRAVLRAAADALEGRRADLLEVMAAEAGKTLDQGDPEVSEAVDFARYYADLARGLEQVPGARFAPARLTVVTPPWNFPVAIPAGSVLAALAAGSAVVLKPAPPARRCGAVLAETLWAAGVPRDVLQLVDVDERTLGSALVADPRVDRVVLTGSWETAELFRSLRPDLPLLAETSGKNAIVVTPSADLDLAVRDVVASAFGHAGQKCSAASLVVLVGSVARSRRFRTQLLDAVTSLRVGPPDDPTTQMGPLVEPASGKLLDGLTTLGPGERWAVEPRRLDAEGRLWTPGVRVGVRPGSDAHRTEWFGPVLAVMTAGTLDEAIALQNDVDYGLTAGLHSLDEDEITHWLAHVEAGNVYVNRGITGAIVRRQPFGGWKRSVVGPTTKAGGPHYLFGFGTWHDDPATAGHAAAPLPAPVTRLLDAAAAAALPAPDLRAVRHAAAAAAHVWATDLGVPTDVSALEPERDVLRHLPVPVHVRLAEGVPVADLLRVLAAGLTAGATGEVSVPAPLPDALTAAVSAAGFDVHVQDDAAWAGDLPHVPAGRVRLVGGDVAGAAHAAEGRADLTVHGGPVTSSGLVELLPFVREQAVSVTAHRFGTPDPLADRVVEAL